MIFLSWLLNSLTCRKADVSHLRHLRPFLLLATPLVQRGLETFSHSHLPRTSWKSFQALLILALLLWGTETLFIACLTFPSRLFALQSHNGSSKPLWRGKAWNTIDLHCLRTGSSARRICPSITELFAPSKISVSPPFWLMAFKTAFPS